MLCYAMLCYGTAWCHEAFYFESTTLLRIYATHVSTILATCKFAKLAGTDAMMVSTDVIAAPPHGLRAEEGRGLALQKID